MSWRIVFSILFGLGVVGGAAELEVVADFEGGSVRVVEIDDEARTVSFMPGGEARRGWPCWWYFRIDGVVAGEKVGLRLVGSDSVVGVKGKPLSASWAMPKQATVSADGKRWVHTGDGKRDGGAMVYEIEVEGKTGSVWVAWGPPFTPTMAVEVIGELAEKCDGAEAVELCRSREGRAVPMLRVGDAGKRYGVWVQARQHAWECGSSWVARGFGEWLVSDDAGAVWLRENAEVFLVPVMDVDNSATGNGGKNALPHDHNRDWSDAPHWKEVLAAQRIVKGMIDGERMDVFLDLHNPAPGDPTFFYVLEDGLMKEAALGLRDRFIEIAYGRISRIKPLIPMSNRPKETGASYHPRWRHISANWVAMNGNPETVSLCLETIWNYKNSTTEGYRAVGRELGEAVGEFLGKR